MRVGVTFSCALVVALASSLRPSPSSAQETAIGDTNDVFATRHYPLLSLPQTLWSYLVYPVGQFTIYSEHTKLPERARNWFTNEAETFGIFPQVQIGGETRTGGGARLFHSDLFGRDKQLEALYVYSAPERQKGQLLYTDPSPMRVPVALLEWPGRLPEEQQRRRHRQRQRRGCLRGRFRDRAPRRHRNVRLALECR